jgi:hypothetical protein
MGKMTKNGSNEKKNENVMKRLTHREQVQLPIDYPSEKLIIQETHSPSNGFPILRKQYTGRLIT